MTGILHEQPYPGSTTCILIGSLEKVAPEAYARFHSVLWCVDRQGAANRPEGAGGLETLIVDGAGREESQDALLRFTSRNPRHLPTVVVAESVSLRATAEYGAVLDLVLAHLESQHRARQTRQKDAFAWQRHVLQNLPAYSSGRIPGAWQGALRGLPAFVCASGPSLDASAHLLATASGAGVVLAADSALRALARLGVAADFAVSIDAAKVPERCLPEGAQPGRMILGPTSPASWRSHFPAGSVFFASGRQVTLDWLAGQGVAHAPVEASENCGSTALGLAHFLGCAPIYLFGLDLALDPSAPERRHHRDADPALYRNSGFDPSRKAPLVPGNTGADVPSPVIGDLRALNARLAAWPAGLVFNVNDRGARLANATVIHPDRARLPSGDGSKDSRLAQLRGADGAPDATLAAFALVRGAGRACREAMPAVRSAYERGGPAGAAAVLSPLFTDQVLGQVFGAYTMKLIPMLVAPDEDPRASWETALSEIEELAELASSVGHGPPPSG